MAELVDAHDSKSCFARSESSILSSPTKITMSRNNNNSEIISCRKIQLKNNSYTSHTRWYKLGLRFVYEF